MRLTPIANIYTGSRDSIEDLAWLPSGMIYNWTRWQLWDKWPPILAVHASQVRGVVLRRVTKKGVALDWIAIHPNHRGNGIGTGMLLAILQDGKHRGAKQLYLRCKADSPAEAFWRSRLAAEPCGRVGGDVRFVVSLAGLEEHLLER